MGQRCKRYAVLRFWRSFVVVLRALAALAVTVIGVCFDRRAVLEVDLFYHNQWVGSVGRWSRIQATS